MVKPDICIYHHPCMDGFTAAWAVWKRWPDVKFVPGQYGSGIPDMTGKHVLLVDFSYKADVLRQIAETAASVTILDHHKSAEADLNPLLEDGTISGQFDMLRSGAMMSWNYFHPGMRFLPWEDQEPIDHVPYLVQYVQDRDLWTWELKHSREVSAYIQTVSLDFISWDRLASDLEDYDAFESIVAHGRTLLKKQEADIAGALKSTKRRMRIAGYDVPVANMPYVWASEAGNLLCKGEPFAATYFDTGDGMRSFSLRSDKDDPNAVDVSIVASQLGGGGHANASGFRIKLTPLEEI